MPDALDLAADFRTPTRDEWRALVSAVLAKSGIDGDPEEALSHTTYDGIRVKPLYAAEDAPGVEAAGLPGRPPFVRGATEHGATVTGWDVRTRHADPDPAAVNEAAKHDLETGATSLWLVLGPTALAAGALASALNGIDLERVPIALDAGSARPERAEHALLDLCEQRGVDPAALRGTLGVDPIGLRARTGEDADVDRLHNLTEQSKGALSMHLATVDGTVYHDAGASDAQELGIATAVGVAYLRALTDAGLSVDEALERIEFRLAVTAEQFPAIAKLRAARWIWDRVARESGASDARRGQHQHAVTSAAMLTKRDPWVNLLRTTIGCFAAAAGGADAITVAPFDAAIGRSDEFARRIARNTHAILHDESSVARVIDPAGGSWFVESLTDQLAEKAWDVFTRIEQVGGALAALNSGAIGELLAQTQAHRADDIAHRRSPLTGVSEFAFVTEAPVERPALPAPPGGLLPRVRYAQDFEALRDRADAAAQRPRVYLATIGPVAAHTARAAFAANLFQAAGIECVTGPVEEFDGTVACLCGSDKGYAQEAAAAVEALRAAGASYIWLAGQAEVDGVDGNVYRGCDALAVLHKTLDLLGVAA
ncbi:MAG TPA: methylmalonyl-CoA mutase subunit beta [Jatrophihabitans sp.]|nr:methylmalonyl-CoA mutase subunit beta [Jatrophihabitans sp.]